MPFALKQCSRDACGPLPQGRRRLAALIKALRVHPIHPLLVVGISLGYFCLAIFVGGVWCALSSARPSFCPSFRPCTLASFNLLSFSSPIMVDILA